jgi:Ca2+-binding EF-hand superfamily protein
VSDSVAEKDEASSNQVLSEENQARLKEVFFWLQKDAQDQVKDVDRLMKSLNLSIKNSLITSKSPWSPSLI